MGVVYNRNGTLMSLTCQVPEHSPNSIIIHEEKAWAVLGTSLMNCLLLQMYFVHVESIHWIIHNRRTDPPMVVGPLYKNSTRQNFLSRSLALEMSTLYTCTVV